jgi:hypothetical protein
MTVQRCTVNLQWNKLKLYRIGLTYKSLAVRANEWENGLKKETVLFFWERRGEEFRWCQHHLYSLSLSAGYFNRREGNSTATYTVGSLRKPVFFVLSFNLDYWLTSLCVQVCAVFTITLYQFPTTKPHTSICSTFLFVQFRGFLILKCYSYDALFIIFWSNQKPWKWSISGQRILLTKIKIWEMDKIKSSLMFQWFDNY